jgi:uroporphyrinogen decarboxylase
LDFQIFREAFGIARLTQPEIKERFLDADSRGKMEFIYEYFRMWRQVVERFGWAALYMDTNFHGYYEGELISMARDFFKDKISIYCWNGQGTYWLLPGDEMMDFAVRLYEDRERLLDDAKRKCEESIKLAERQIAQGADFIIINSDYAYNQGPFISPEMFSHIVTPFLKEIVTAIHSNGRKALLHSDGDLRQIMDQLVSTGLDGFQSIDPQGHMDIAEVRRQYPDHILMGNVQSSLLQEIDEPLIRESARYAIDSAKPGGRFIFSTSNCIFEGMPLESYLIMLDEYEKMAWY